LLILEQNSNQPFGKFTFYVKFRLTIRVRCFYINVIHRFCPFDFRDNLLVGVGISLGIHFQIGMLFQERVALGKIKVNHTMQRLHVCICLFVGFHALFSRLSQHDS